MDSGTRIETDERSSLISISEEPAGPALLAIDELPAPAVEAIEIKLFDPQSEPGAVAPARPAKAVRATAKIAAPVAAPAPEPLPMPKVTDEKPPEALDTPAHGARPASKGGYLKYAPLAAVSLAVVASGFSAMGLLIASRSVAQSNVVLEDVSRHQSKMRRLDTLIDELETLRSRERIALAKLETMSAAKPATAADVRSAVMGLQMTLAKYQPGPSNGSIAILRDGQAELGDRISAMYRKTERIDDNVSRLVSSNPKARP